MVSVYAKQEFHFNVDNELGRDATEPRFLREEDISNDDVLNTKFVYSEEPAISIKLADLRTAPHFRPTTHKSTTAEAPRTTTVEESTTQTETTTMELTTDTTTNQNAKTDTSTNTNPTETSSFSDKESSGGGAVLFQDLDENKNAHNVQINYQMKGVYVTY